MSTSIQKPKEFGLRLDAKRRTFLVRLGLLIITSVLFTLAGPFGTFQAGGFFDRLLYWFVVNGVSILIAVNVKNLVIKKFAHWAVFQKESAAIFVTTLLFTPILWLWTITMFPGLIVSPPTMIWMGSIVFVICVSISALLYGVPFVMKYTNPPIEPSVTVARIVRRLPETFDGKIIHLAVDGHIVRVMTDAGIFDLRMRFADAVEEVSELGGICTHRSHWVVLAEIARVGMVNGRPCLKMSNGEEVPVSRKYQPGLVAIGIL